MAYQATRNRKITEQLDLIDEDGQAAETITVELDADKVAEKLSVKYLDVVKTQESVNKMAQDIKNQEGFLNAYETLGNAVLDLMEAVFGPEDTAKIRRFYGGNYIEMTQQVMPFIINIVLPKVRETAQQNRRDALKRYNRKTRKSVSESLR